MTLLTLRTSSSSRSPAEGADRTSINYQSTKVGSPEGTVTKSLVSGGHRSHTLQALLPDTEYQLYLVAINVEGMSNASSAVTFRTLASGECLGMTVSHDNILACNWCHYVDCLFQQRVNPMRLWGWSLVKWLWWLSLLWHGFVQLFSSYTNGARFASSSPRSLGTNMRPKI